MGVKKWKLIQGYAFAGKISLPIYPCQGTGECSKDNQTCSEGKICTDNGKCVSICDLPPKEAYYSKIQTRYGH